MFFRNQECANRDFDMNATFVGDNNNIENEMNMNVDVNMPAVNNSMMCGCSQRPMCEPVQERCIHKTIVHEVPHVCPIRTRVINHHVYKHTYRPEFSCQEENVVSNVQCGSCCQFR